MLQLDTGTGNCSRDTQAAATGSLHRLITMFLRYPPQTHQPRPSGSLILIRIQKKDGTCQETIPMSSSSSFPACSSTTSTQCQCTSLHRIPAATPKAQGRGALGCRISGSLGQPDCLLQVGLQVFIRVALVSFVLPVWVHPGLFLHLNHTEVFNFNP